MILFLLGIILTVIAWKKGWRWKSLFPWAFCILLGLIVAFLGPGNEGAATLTKVITEILLLTMLIAMCVKKR